MRQQYLIQPGGETLPVDSALGPMVGFISWNRLFAEAFRAAREIKPNERIPSFQVDDRGITFTVVT